MEGPLVEIEWVDRKHVAMMEKAEDIHISLSTKKWFRGWFWRWGLRHLRFNAETDFGQPLLGP
jgi:hypothetical protein